MTTESPEKNRLTERIAALGEPPQIEAATTFDTNVVVTAGPGTGKTRVLTERYLYALETGLADVPQIVAFTLTEKAAAEMTSRIRRACLCEAARPDEPDERRRFWHERAARLEAARISTLHSAAATICRRHAEVLGVDPEFAVIDELESVPFQDEFLDGWLHAVQRSEAAADFATLLDEYGLPRMRRALEGFIAERSRLGYHDLEPLSAEEYTSRLLAVVRKELSRPELKEAARFVESVRPSDPDDKLAPAWQVVVTAIRHLEEGKLTLEEAGAIPASVKVNVGRAACWGGKESLAKLKDKLKRIREALKDVAPPVTGDDELNRSLAHSRTLLESMACVRDRLWADLREFKRRRGVFDFEDLLVECERLLREHDDVRRAERRRIRYLMVDELQDSSRIDAAIIRHLGMPSDDPEERDLPDDRLFIVGDDKQSIYRFRGADVSVFREIAEGLGERRRPVSLVRNFRSSAPLIGLFNRVFDCLMPDDPTAADFENRYADLAHNPKRDPHPAFASTAGEAIMIAGPSGKDDDGPKMTEGELRRVEAATVAREIAHLVRERGVGAGDVAMLFRSMGHVSLYARALEAEGLPYYVNAGRGFFERQEVRDLTVALEFVEHPHDALSLVGTLRGGLFGVSDRTLFWLAHEDDPVRRFHAGQWPERIDPAERDLLERARRLLLGLVEGRDRMALPELIDALVHDTGYDIALAAGFEGRQALANVNKFVQQAAGAAGMGIESFVKAFRRNIELEARQASAALEAEADVIRLMTIHAAKGLEFPVVAMPECNVARHGRRQDHHVVLHHPETGWAAAKHREDPVDLARPPDVLLADIVEKRMEEAELKRLLFVAMTRAEDYLLMTGSGPIDADTGLPSVGEPGFMGYLLGGLAQQPPAPGERHEVKLPLGGTFSVRGEPADAAGDETAASASAPSARAALDAIDGADPDASNARPLLQRIAPPPFEEKPPERIGVSALLDYDRCPARFALHHRLGVGDDPLGIDLPENVNVLVGTAFHELAALETEPDDETIDAVLANVLWSEGKVGEALHRRLRKEVAAMLERFRTSDLAARMAGADAAHSEIAFTLPVGGTLVEGQIDKLLLEGGGYAVVDFKTGGSKDLDTRYRRQLDIYAAAVERTLPEVARREIVLYHAADGTHECHAPAPAEEIIGWMETVIAGIARAEFPPGEGCDEGCPHRSICRRLVGTG